MRRSININDNIYEEIKKVAKNEKSSITTMINVGLKEFLLTYSLENHPNYDSKYKDLINIDKT